jgi:hypothetical protein
VTRPQDGPSPPLASEASVGGGGVELTLDTGPFSPPRPCPQLPDNPHQTPKPLVGRKVPGGFDSVRLRGGVVGAPCVPTAPILSRSVGKRPETTGRPLHRKPGTDHRLSELCYSASQSQNG